MIVTTWDVRQINEGDETRNHADETRKSFGGDLFARSLVTIVSTVAHLSAEEPGHFVTYFTHHLR